MIPLAIASSAIGFVAWRIQAKRGTVDPGDTDDLANTYGWLAPGMEPHWRRVEAGGSIGDQFHDLKNITTEHCRAHAEAASKFLCFAIALGFAAGAFLIALPAFVLGLAL